jgi:hypothetical protein
MGHSTGVRKVIGDDIGRNVRLRSAGRIPALIGARVVPASWFAMETDACLPECRSQQAGAQQHEAGRRQGKKSVGDNVVVAHVTPTTQMLVRIY